MSWKDILVFADGSENGFARVQMAGDLAASTDAALEVCVPICLPALSASGGVDFAVDLYDELERGARDDAVRAVQDLRRRAPQLSARLDVTTPEVKLPDVARLAGSLGQTSDLVIAGQPIAEDLSRVDDALLEGALFRAGRPCLMFPQWNRPPSWGKRIVIARKEAPGAGRAVHDAMPLLQRADAVCVICVQRGSHIERTLDLSTQRLLRHLARFGVKAESRVVLSTGPDGPTLLDQAERWSADLIVMGAYGHSQFRERIFGGATREAIRGAKMPVLLSH